MTVLPVDSVDTNNPMPRVEDILRISSANSSGIQFKNSLKYIQGGTNVTLDRMIERFDLVLAELYTQGYRAGLEEAAATLRAQQASQVAKKPGS